MRDPERIERILAKLRFLWLQSPDLRLGQILVGMVGRPSKGFDIFYEEDDKVEEELDRIMAAQHAQRKQGHYTNLHYE